MVIKKEFYCKKDHSSKWFYFKVEAGKTVDFLYFRAVDSKGYYSKLQPVPCGLHVCAPEKIDDSIETIKSLFNLSHYNYSKPSMITGEVVK